MGLILTVRKQMKNCGLEEEIRMRLVCERQFSCAIYGDQPGKYCSQAKSGKTGRSGERYHYIVIGERLKNSATTT